MLADGSFHARALDGRIPPNQDEIIVRHGLLDRLDHAARVTRICSPAGSGKSVPVRFPAEAVAGAELGLLLAAVEVARASLDQAERHLAEAEALLERALDAAESDGVTLSFAVHPAPSGPREPGGPLTDGEARILRYLPTNLPVPEIAERLCLSVHTVRTHTRHLYEKLSAHSRTQAVEQARALGLLAPSAH